MEEIKDEPRINCLSNHLRGRTAIGCDLVRRQIEVIALDEPLTFYQLMHELSPDTQAHIALCQKGYRSPYDNHSCFAFASFIIEAIQHHHF
ncbi:MAG: hypothetical protein US94_C0018G0002 [Berkelbacteria bacterium GW2011_GWB1_38_5]|uniref:Uncharacterized protein n=1 Tax=Berkelbacteria bacterium GW2011_GWB1_38_5 TaxID=1618336 RepID=A0A0G0MJP8_9BACT|nr:MAG: hypothetical protein US94_C0018G0002 [Berkelbacteria bacterium GW2011_GWB1_38_5]